MFERLQLIISEEDINKVKDKNILIVGVGGVGGACFEALVRLGVQKFTIIDNDVFDKSNLNRQLLSNLSNIGQNKAKEAKIRGLNINNDCLIDYKEIFLIKENIDEINIDSYDYIIDCCDTLTTKVLLIEKALEHNKKIICATGTGNRLNPTMLKLTNIWKTNNDPLAKNLRKALRDKNIKAKIPVVASDELPIKTGERTVGSCALVPNTAGFYIAYWVFNDIINTGK